RQGIEVERQPRDIYIHSLELLGLTATTMSFRVHCSKGTYVRNLVEDMGEMLGCGAHVAVLKRSAVGPYDSDAMVTMEQLRALYDAKDWPALNSLLLPDDTMVSHYPTIDLTDTAMFYLNRGQSVQVPNAPTDGLVRLIQPDGTFMGVGEIDDDGKIAPKRLKVTQ
ncbi:MAG: tRNA pseudouridine(55) synthase TruB, partial [Coxiellaceae bacterium]|nr:tRNA pseudouridine(55) synthase TruB [Coxiellaceae bacterium]